MIDTGSGKGDDIVSDATLRIMELIRFKGEQTPMEEIENILSEMFEEVWDYSAFENEG